MKQTMKMLFSGAGLIFTLTQSHAAHVLDLQGDYLLGDWNGSRERLAEQGVKFDANITVDTAYLAQGGYNDQQDPTYTSQLWLGSSLDLEKLLDWDGVSLRTIVTARQGQSVSVKQLSDPLAPQLGNVQASYGRGNQESRLSELSIEKQFKDQSISVRLGRFGMGTYFNVMSCDFQNTSFCTAQMGKWQGSSWYNIPVSQWAGMLKYQINPELYAQFAVFEFNPTNIKENQGWNLSSSNADGITAPIELVWQPKNAVNNLAGSYRIGMMYNTADNIENQKDIVTGQAQDHTYGMWFVAEQQLTRQGSGKQGLHGFMNLSFHDDTTNKIDNMQQVGLKYIGLLENRENDILGLGLNRIHVSDRYRKHSDRINKSAEYNVELNYSYYPTKWAMLRPNIQYVINPGATNYVDNALVLGLTTRIIF
ncbi:carbohydrate porin [Acinetobacter guillouiae]|uniref:carbohydrate porin n=1 Tax=Acinetobacter guillouiae TaxID=106649 RepID=UPI0012500EA0|nr:carbohydrate porin [Acinetobacter guillouiae]